MTKKEQITVILHQYNAVLDEAELVSALLEMVNKECREEFDKGILYEQEERGL